MLSSPRPRKLAITSIRPLQLWTLYLVLWCLATVSTCMTDDQISGLSNETVEIFYHGYLNYFKYAFPEDELKPLSCTPLFRDRANPAHIEVNDVLGNYSLTLIDSLSTIAILASSPLKTPSGHTALEDFQEGVATVVELYGDGSVGANGQGTRSRGFDQDSKVQVFETVIRGVGGLLSAHLFAIGELPINGYRPVVRSKESWKDWEPGIEENDSKIKWPSGFVYNGQLLRLAVDLATRLLPAFESDTGLPYPRVNLRFGVPFYPNSPLNSDPEHGQCLNNGDSGSAEITETCSAGAGSLVLEFSTLSRLTGDAKFEIAAKRAFHAVWERRSNIDLIGSGIDAETGYWVSPVTGTGAGIDSYFEYALKSHILLSGLGSMGTENTTITDPDFLQVWQDSHAAIKRHLYRGSDFQHPHYIQGDLFTGASRAFWIDSLSAYYPGLLALGGELDEAIETHMLHAAIWTRYAGFPERWSTATGNIESGLRWWGGRPEFIESTWYLYRATKDPWYLHVAEMTLRDIKRRCWTECGWAGLEDVRSGELKDRMESFFLGETTKYLYLLFDPQHPLNTLDAPYVFTTEGHPLLIPQSYRRSNPRRQKDIVKLQAPSMVEITEQPTCPTPSPLLPFTISPMASRHDFFHAASLARLHQVFLPLDSSEQAIESAYSQQNLSWLSYLSPNNYSYYPWTLPTSYIPANGQSSELGARVTFDLSFPTLSNSPLGATALKRVEYGIQIGSLSGLKLGMIREMDTMGDLGDIDVFRIHSVAHNSLGRDEKVLITPQVFAALNPTDPYFTRHREISTLDIIVDAVSAIDRSGKVLSRSTNLNDMNINIGDDYSKVLDSLEGLPLNLTLGNLQQVTNQDGTFFQTLLEQLSSILGQRLPSDTSVKLGSLSDLPTTSPSLSRHVVFASGATGVGAAPLPDLPDASENTSEDSASSLPWVSIYVGDDGCDSELPIEIVNTNHVVVLRRGGCSFVKKLENIPGVASTASSLQMVIIVSDDHQSSDPKADPEPLVHPLLDTAQRTSSGLPRYNPIPLVMLGGGEATMEILRRAKGVGMRRRYHFSSQGIRISNLFVV